MFFTNSRCSACGESTDVALSLRAASEPVLSGPVSLGKNRLPTTPQAATMNKLKTGGASAAQAERIGSPSRKGKPTATAPARKKARRLIPGRWLNGRAVEL